MRTSVRDVEKLQGGAGGDEGGDKGHGAPRCSAARKVECHQAAERAHGRHHSVPPAPVLPPSLAVNGTCSRGGALSQVCGA